MASKIGRGQILRERKKERKKSQMCRYEESRHRPIETSIRNKHHMPQIMAFGVKKKNNMPAWDPTEAGNERSCFIAPKALAISRSFLLTYLSRNLSLLLTLRRQCLIYHTRSLAWRSRAASYARRARRKEATENKIQPVSPS